MFFSVFTVSMIVSIVKNSLAQSNAGGPANYIADCLTSWEVRRDSSAPGSIPKPDLATMESCLDACGIQEVCTAAEVDYNDNTVLCWHHNEIQYIDNRRKTKGVVHYRRRRQCLRIKVDPNAAAGGMLGFINQMQGLTDSKIPTCNDIVDVAFIVDVSASVEEYGVNAGYFNLYVKVFLINFVRYLAIGLDKIRVGMVTFEDTAQLIFPLTSNATAITELINGVVYGDDEEYGEDEEETKKETKKEKKIASGLDLARQQVLSPGSPKYRAEAVHMAILLTDGGSTSSDRMATLKSATELKKQGVFVQVVGITPKVDLDELTCIASPVSDFNAEAMRRAVANATYVFGGAVSYFPTVEYLTQGLNELVDHQSNTICPRQRLPIVCNDYADVVLLIDMSASIETHSRFTNYFDRFLRAFLLRFVRLLNIRPGRIQVAVVTYATAGQVALPLTSSANTVYTKLNNLAYEKTGDGIKNLSDALYLVKNQVLNPNSSNFRHDSLHIVVVFGDGARTGSSTVAQSHARDLTRQEVLIITVPVTPNPDQTELELIASSASELNRPGASESVRSGFVQMSDGAVVPSEVETATVVNKVIRIQSLVLCPDRSTAASACSYELDHGIGCILDGSTRWFYRESSDSCSTFDYNGCGGNPNSFSDRELCEKTCIKSDLCLTNPCSEGEQCIKSLRVDNYTKDCIPKGAPYPCPRPLNCSLDCTYGRSQDGDGCEVCRCNHPCDTVTCSKKSICSVGIIYSSETPPSILGYVGECIFTEGDVQHSSASAGFLPSPDAPSISQPDPSGCKMELDIGFRCVTAPVLRWYYKEIFNNCSQFDFQGCGGNGNNFVDRETCEKMCRISYKEQCKAHACPEGLECEMIDMSLLCPIETPCPGMTTIRCVAPTEVQKRYCTFHSGISSDYALAVVDLTKHITYVVVRQTPPPSDNPESNFLWYEDSSGTLRSKTEQCISDGIPSQLVRCDTTSVRWFFDNELNVIRTAKDDKHQVKALAVVGDLTESDQKISIPKHLVVTEDYLRSVGQQTHEGTWTKECI